LRWGNHSGCQVNRAHQAGSVGRCIGGSWRKGLLAQHEDFVQFLVGEKNETLARGDEGRIIDFHTRRFVGQGQLQHALVGRSRVADDDQLLIGLAVKHYVAERIQRH
jgi:hypothetical protein